MATKSRSGRSKKGNTTPPPPVVETGDASQEVASVAPEASASSPDGAAQPEALVAAAPETAADETKPRKRSARPRKSAAPKSTAPKSARPRARKSKMPAPPSVDAPQLELTPTPTPALADAPALLAKVEAELAPTPIAETPIPRPAPVPSYEMTPPPFEAHASPAETEPIDPDDVSVPPAVEALDDHFFSAPTSKKPSIPPEHDPLFEAIRRDPILEHKMTPAVAARRERLTRIVKGAVGIAAALCFIAALVHFASRHSPTTSSMAIAAESPRAAAPSPQAAEAPQPKEATPPVEQPGAATAARTGETAQEAQPATEPQPEPSAAPQEPEHDPALAKQQKRDAQRALERYDLPKAIDLGEKSVANDPTDAEAWLILGAAYQSKGKMTDAKHAFHECIEQGKGPRRWECFQFPH